MLNIFHKKMLLVQCHPSICLQSVPCQNHDWQMENHWNWQATTVWKGGKRQLFFCRIGFVRRRSMSSAGAPLSSFFVGCWMSNVLCMASRQGYTGRASSTNPDFVRREREVLPPINIQSWLCFRALFNYHARLLLTSSVPQEMNNSIE